MTSTFHVPPGIAHIKWIVESTDVGRGAGRHLQRPDLGPKQLAWLRKHIPAFDLSWTAVKAADENAAKQNAKVLGK